MWNIVKKSLTSAWHFLDVTRTVIANVFLLLLIIVLAVFAFRGDSVTVKDNSMLEINLSGNVVEQSSFGSREAALAMALSGTEPETQLRDVLRALKLAKNDPKIRGVVVRLDDLGRVGLASLREIGVAMDRFRSKGKKIIAWATGFNQKQYAIASHASEVYVHPMGEVMLTGLSSSRLYWGEALRKAGVTVHVFKAGAYKSFPEIFVRQYPSAESLLSEREWMQDAWDQLVESIQTSRGLMPGAVSKLIRSLEGELMATHGDMSAVAINANLVDAVKTADEVNDLLLERQGGKKGKDKLNLIDYLDYLAANPEENSTQKGVAVIVLEGEIRDGYTDFGRGHVGARNVIKLIREAKEAASIAAIVVRVDSPGGSAVASEMIRRELELTKKAGKPIVVSMGDMATSGGYWVSLAASRIVADPASVTGSIGVFGMMPTIEKTLEKFSVGSGGTKTEWLAGNPSMMMPLDPRYERVLELTVARTYRDFLSLVSQSRGIQKDAVERVAQGRVYTGRQAVTLRLVDQLGGMQEAIEEARALSHLKTDAPIYWFEDAPNTVRTWLEKLLVRIEARINPVAPMTQVAKEPLNVVRNLTDLMRGTSHVLAHSLCHVD